MASVEGLSESRKFSLRNAARIVSIFSILGISACATTTAASEVPQFDPVTKTLTFDSFRLSKFAQWIEATRAPDKAGLNVSGVIKFLTYRGCNVEDIIPIPGYSGPIGVYYKLTNPDCIKEFNQK